MLALLIVSLAPAACMDLGKVVPAFRPQSNRPPAVTRDQAQVRETLTRDDGVIVERVVSGCEHLDVTLTFRELRGTLPDNRRQLAERAIKEFDRTPFGDGERSRQLFRDTLQAALKSIMPAPQMNAPIPFPCGGQRACTIAIGGAPGHGWAIYWHNDFAQ